MTNSKRLTSLDVLRGLTVLGMILVNNGVGDEQFSTLQHSKWNGLTPCDLVFPFFLFMVGMSLFLSLRKCDFTPSSRLFGKVALRTVGLFAIGVALHAWEGILKGDASLLEHLRVMGVLQRIALCYCISTFIILYMDHRHLWRVIMALLIIYSGILMFGNGYEQDESNWVSIVDRGIFGAEHVYRKSPIDPEGLLGTISSVAHTLIGFVVAKALLGGRKLTGDVMEGKARIFDVLLISFVIGLAGYLLQFGLPLNKRVWSPSYVLVTCSMASGLLAVFTYVIDYCGVVGWSRLCRYVGTCALSMYIISEIFSPLLSHIGANEWVYQSALAIGLGPQWASVVYAVAFILFVCLAGYAYDKVRNGITASKRNG